MGEHERIVDKLNRRQFLCRHHELERFNALTYGGGDTRIGARGRPNSQASGGQTGNNRKQADLAHLTSSI